MACHQVQRQDVIAGPGSPAVQAVSGLARALGFACDVVQACALGVWQKKSISAMQCHRLKGDDTSAMSWEAGAIFVKRVDRPGFKSHL